MKKDPFNQIIKKWLPKGVFVDLLEKYLSMNVGLWSSLYVWSWKHFMTIFVMFVNEEVCEIVIISSSTDYELYHSFNVKCLLQWNSYKADTIGAKKCVHFMEMSAL